MSRWARSARRKFSEKRTRRKRKPKGPSKETLQARANLARAVAWVASETGLEPEALAQEALAQGFGDSSISIEEALARAVEKLRGDA